MNLRWALVSLVWLAGCFQPTLSSGGLECSSSGKCPPGFHCASDHRCWKSGTDPGPSDSDGGGSDDQGVDLGVDDLGDVDLSPVAALGQACSSATECVSGFCADGVCCDGACTGACEACGTSGMCTQIPAGALPAAGHPSCGPDAQSTCMRDGTCDGAGACQLWSNITCKPGSCDPATNKATAPSKCDGKGTCVTPNPVACDPFLCLPDNSACYPSCTGASTGCKAPNPCNAGSCGPKANGSPCMMGTQCQTGNCSPDGYCCDQPCTGKCEACDVGLNPGTCTAITTGQPEASHGGNCTAYGTTCGGACAAGNRAACSFPGDGNLPNVTCANTSCKDSVTQYNTAQCNGSGGCNTQSTTGCGAYKCVGSACASSCSNNSDTNCAPSHYCNLTSCLTTKPVGRGCAGDTECTGNHCIDLYCCDGTCPGRCEACNVANYLGTCTALTSGQPHHGGNCAGYGTTCGGSCASGNRTTCSFPGNQLTNVVCIAQTCSGTTQYNTTSCNGAGGCSTQTTTACNPPVGGTCYMGACCVPETCNSMGWECGASNVDNGCGGTFSCPNCSGACLPCVNHSCTGC